MTVTDDLVTDLLPVYFSGEASADTRRIVDDFFREHPVFERVARRAATPVEQLRHAPAVSADASAEMAAFQAVRRRLRRTRIWFALAILFSCLPLSFGWVGSGSGTRLVWMMLRDDPWQAAICWAYAAVCWWMYLRRRQS